jgi:hypothetical protein
MTIEEVFANLPKGIVPWLDYQATCGREMLLSESYLAQPIGELLRLNHGGDVKAEFNHPIITAPARGRRRQVDYALLGKTGKKLVAGLEVKWADDTALSKQRLVDDLLRLECLKASPTSRQSAARFFLVAGRTTHVKTNLVKLQSNVGGRRAPFLPWFLDASTDKAITVDVTNAPEYIQKYFKSFEASYKVLSPTAFRTRRVADVTRGDFRAILWNVDSGAGQRSTFSATQRWPTISVPEVEDQE